ncbi:uncharacterized [Tachysurus ichikawai]
MSAEIDSQKEGVKQHEYETEKWLFGGWGGVRGEGEGLMIGEMDEVLKKACAVCYCCPKRYKYGSGRLGSGPDSTERRGGLWRKTNLPVESSKEQKHHLQCTDTHKRAPADMA